MSVIGLAVPAIAAHPASWPGRLIAVGDGTVSGAGLKPYSNAWMFSFTKNGKIVDQGVWSDVLRSIDVDGTHLFERVQGMTYRTGQSSVTINRFDPLTLAPVYSEQHTPDGKVVKRSFAGTHLELHLKPATSAAEQVTKTDLPSAVYDFNGGMYGLLIATQPLRPGYSASIPAVGEFDNKPGSIPFRVARRATLDAGFKGRTSAWVVEVHGDNPMTFWISDKPPYILRLEIPMSGGKAIYAMIH